MQNPFKSKKFKYGGLSVIVTVLFITGIVLLNVVVNMVLSRTASNIDLTAGELYSIETKTEDYLKKITDKVTITVTSTEDTFNNNGAGFVQTNEIIKRFVEANSNISVRYVDLLKNPTFAANYSEELSPHLIIVESENTKRHKILTFEDYLSIEYDQQYLMMGQKMPTSVKANGEQALTTAIMSVTDVSPVRVAYATGFGEITNVGMNELLEKNSYVLESIDLTMVDAIDSEISYVVLYAPTADYSNEVLNKLDKWLDNDGKYGKNLMYVASATQSAMPNLDGFLAEWGIEVMDGVIYQANNQYSSPMSPTYQYLSGGNSTYTNGLNPNYMVYGDRMRPLKLLFTEEGGYATSTILKSFEGAVIRPSTAEDDWTPENAKTGEYPAAVESKKVVYDGSTPSYTRMLVFSSEIIFAPQFLAANGVNNAELLINMVNEISGKEEGVKLTPKSFEMATFQMPSGQANAIAIVFAVVIPVLLVVFGIVVWTRRRHR